MPTRIDPKDLLTRFIREVWSEGDVDACDKYLARTYTIHHDPGDPWEGQTLDLAGYKERVRALRRPFPDQSFDLQGLFEDGNRVVLTWLWSATHLGDIPGFPATGRQIKMSGATVYFLEGARLAGHWQITDRLGVYQQLQGASSRS
jgi:steroid delta-isomerase-like uncharacterized protein